MYLPIIDFSPGQKYKNIFVRFWRKRRHGLNPFGFYCPLTVTGTYPQVGTKRKKSYHKSLLVELNHCRRHFGLLAKIFFFSFWPNTSHFIMIKLHKQELVVTFFTLGVLLGDMCQSLLNVWPFVVSVSVL